MRYDLEWKIHKEGLSEEERVKQIGLNKVNYGWFTEGLERGFDIITNKKYNDVKDPGSKPVFDAHCTKPTDVWTKVVNNSSKGFDDIKLVEDLKLPVDINSEVPLWKTS